MKTRIPYLLATVLFSLVFLLVAGPLMGQSPTGALRGTVIDPSGARIASAQIEMVDSATGTQYATKTDATGDFLIGNLSPGSYTVTVTKDQFKTGVYKDVKIIVSETYTLTAKLAVGVKTELVGTQPISQIIKAPGVVAFDETKLSVVAMRFDGFIELSLNAWDALAGLLLIEEAGGYIAPFPGPQGLRVPAPVLGCAKGIGEPLTKLVGAW